jgi:hypothetical protein
MRQRLISLNQYSQLGLIFPENSVVAFESYPEEGPVAHLAVWLFDKHHLPHLVNQDGLPHLQSVPRVWGRQEPVSKLPQ